MLAFVRGLIEKGWHSRFYDWHRVEAETDHSRMPAILDALGYRREDESFNRDDPAYLFFFIPSQFNAECAKAGFRPDRVLALLKARGILAHDADGRNGLKVRLPERGKLPSGTSRSYCIIGRKLDADALC